MALFFPVYGFTPGIVTAEDFKKKGYFVENYPGDNDKNCDVRGFTFWDHDNDGYFEDIYTTNAYALPEAWEDKYGLSWRLSYNGWISKLRDLGFEIDVWNEPQIVVNDKGEQQLEADFDAVSPDKDFYFRLNFQMGNDYGEGATEDSPRSLYSIIISTDMDSL